MTRPRDPRMPRLLHPLDDPLIHPQWLLLVRHSVPLPVLPIPPSSRLTDPPLSRPPDPPIVPLSVPLTVLRSRPVFPCLHPLIQLVDPS